MPEKSFPKINYFYFFLFGTFSGLALSFIINPSSSETAPIFKEIRNRQNNSYINPLLECENSQISNTVALSDLKKSLESIIEKEKAVNNATFFSIYYRDLNNGPWIGINEKELFSPASLIKVPVMMAYYKEAESNPDILNKTLTNSHVYNPEDQNIDPETTILPNREYSIEELINRMIIYSDNQAYDTLTDNIDNTKIYSIYNLLGIDLSKAHLDPSGNIITVKDYAGFYRLLYNSSYLSQKMSEKALKLLTQTKYKDALYAGVPQHIEVAHKFGERQFLPSQEKQLHDCGIVYHPQNPYLLCIMSRGQDFKKLSNIIKNISKATYDHLTQ